MELVKRDIAESRAHTDASLGAERASTDTDNDRTAARAQRILDDHIEHDRLLADRQLLKFRDSADSTRARDRSESPAVGQSVEIERALADEGTRVERQVTDAFVEQERQRADAAVEINRQGHDAQRTRLEAHREETDEQLSRERSGSDVAVATFEQTKVALAQAERTQGQRDAVLGMVTHDLRSPLCIIVMNAQSIAEDSKEAQTIELAREVTRSAARMERLLTDLLDVARIESGTLRILKRQHDVGALVAEIWASYRPLFADRGMTFSAEGPDTPLAVAFDHDRIVQVLSNLLGNAMKFTPRQGTIGLHVERRGDQVEFVLRDSGPGIRPDVLPHVFERFWQVDVNTRRGLGLGLYICEKIVQAHGGRIWVESDFGHGAAFRFTLPLV
jgi:signal transduction histidine kinase